MVWMNDSFIPMLSSMTIATPQELVHDIAPDSPEPLRAQLAYWLSTQPRFAQFIETYADKIRRKFRLAQTDEDARDVLAELDTAWRFTANPDNHVVYEPYGDKGCDFRIDTPSGNFNAEKKRIREAAAMSKYYNCLDRIVAAVRAVPSQLGISLECYSLDIGPEYAKAIDGSIDVIVAECLARLKHCKDHLAYGESQKFSITGFQELQIQITHVPQKSADSPTANFGGVYPILYTQKEAFKFTDLLLGHLHQFTADFPNVLIIQSHSTTHHAEDLPMAACEIHQHVADGNERFFQHKKFSNIQDFQDRFTLLSAAIVITGTDIHPRNLVWVNPAAAKPFDDTLLKYFAEM